MKADLKNIKPVRSKDKFLVFGAPAIEDDEIQEVVASMKSGWLGTGPKAARFEADFAKYKSVKYSAAVNSCTALMSGVINSVSPSSCIPSLPSFHTGNSE